MKKMKKRIAALAIIALFTTMLLPISSMAVTIEESAFSVIYSADGDNLPNGHIGKDGGTSVSAVSAKGGLGKDENDTYIKMKIVGTKSGFIFAPWGDNSQHTNNVWYKSSYKGYVICEAEIYSKSGFASVRLGTDGNATVSNSIGGLEANKWYHVAFVIDCYGNGKESTQAYVNGVPFGKPCTNGVLGDNMYSNGFRARNDLRMIFTLPGTTGGEFYVDNLCYYETDTNAFGEGIPEDFSDQALSCYTLGNAPTNNYKNYKGTAIIGGVGACHGSIGGKTADDYALKLNYNVRPCINIIKAWDNAKNSNYVGYYNAEYDLFVETDYRKLGQIALTSDGGAFISCETVTGASLAAMGDQNPWVEGGWNRVSYIIECRENGDKKTVHTYINGVLVGTRTDSLTLDGKRGDIRFSIFSTEAAPRLKKTEWDKKTLDEKLAYAGKDSVVNINGDYCYFDNPVICYVDNIHTYESKGNVLYSWNGSAGTINDSIYISRSPEYAVGGKMSGDISDHVTDVDKGDGGAPYIEYLWGEAEQNCSDEADAAAKWTKGSFVGYLVTEVNVLNNGKFGDFSIRTRGNQPVSNAVGAAALKEGWNKLAVVIENKAAEDGSIVRTAREYVNGEEIIPENDETVMLGKYNSSDKYCMNELRLVFKGDGANGGDLDIYIDDINIYETDSEPILDKPIIPGKGVGMICDSGAGKIYVTDFSGKTAGDIGALISDVCRARVYADENMTEQINGSEALSTGQRLVIEGTHKTYTTYTVAQMPQNEIIVSGKNCSSADKTIQGPVNIGAYAPGGGVLIAAQYNEEGMLGIQIVKEADAAGMLSMNYVPEKRNGSRVKTMLLKHLEDLAPLCAQKEFNLKTEE